jgi:poly-gamma-glutamate capsule biosynthesis protein CapA/YwtB (metallophosphatase superfamily)
MPALLRGLLLLVVGALGAASVSCTTVTERAPESAAGPRATTPAQSSTALAQPSTTPTSPSTSASAARPPVGRGAGLPRTGKETRPVTLAFAGDIQFEDQLRPRLDDPAAALSPIRSQLSAADLTIANLETSITTRGHAEPKAYTFRAPASALDAVAAAGIDVVSMANNHGVDFGPQGLADTLAAVEDAPLGVVGIGHDADHAFAPHVTTIRGTSVAVIGATAFNDPTARNYPAGQDRAGVAVAVDPAQLTQVVKNARRRYDVVVVYLHWGTEGMQCPDSDQRELARELADAGADVVIGSHAHVLLGAGRLDQTYVGYGLGNFVWRNRRSVARTTTGVLTLTMDGHTVAAAELAPAMIGADGLPHFADGDQAREMRRDFASLRACTDLEPVPEPPA